MKTLLLFLSLLLFSVEMKAQENEPSSLVREQAMENLTEKQDAETRDDSYWQQMDELHKHKLNLNTVNKEDLQTLQLLTDLQVEEFLSYRKLLGSLVNIYELQAVPGWDIEIIKQVLPFVFAGDTVSIIENFKGRFHGGENNLLIRFGQQLEKAKGFKEPAGPTSSHYLGSPQQLFFRYKYNYKNLVQYGLLGDKDAGEQFFRGKQKYGFDFYSFHLYAKDIGIIKSLAIGDFTVNMGQGLIQWQSLAFTKSADVLLIKRQSTTLRPYNSAGEFNFHRGAGISFGKGKFETTAFVSYRNISANLATDTITKTEVVTSFQTSGYHRTQNENAGRNDLRQITIGGNIKIAGNNYRLGINAVHYNFSYPIKKQERPYNLFALQGKSWANESIDYSYTFRNIHFFGEAAMDQKLNTAFVNGILMSLSPSVDVSVLHRKINKAYQSLYSDAFTENTTVNNETGLYAGISIHPSPALQIDAYADFYKFPWLKYNIDASSSGRDYFIQLNYGPNKTWSIYTRFKNEAKQKNSSDENMVTHLLQFISTKDWRTEYAIHVNKELLFKNRLEIIWYNQTQAINEQGFLNAFDIFYKPARKSFSGNMRLQYFETSGYNSRVYVYEEDVLYNYSIPFFYGKGIRYYININFDFRKIFFQSSSNKSSIEFWLKWAQTIYQDQATVGTVLDMVNGNKKSHIQFQVIIGW